jgi:hypothetical protein
MSAEQREWGEKNFRRPGDPLQVQICRMDDPEVNEMVRMANRMGYVPYQQRDHKDRDWLYVDVLGGGLIYRAPDAVFQEVPDGLYHFTKDEKGNVYVEGPF